ncbi:family 20 glycosylhydrolase [Ekhidna sp.]|uniref:glycoside hydrolase family 20 protein n=1 Tax=Ekhidna sp. TaxID=2608089 RepID=UPI003B5B3526
MRLSFLILQLALLFACSRPESINKTSIIPVPAKLEVEEGIFMINEFTTLTLPEECKLDVVKDYFQELTGYELHAETETADNAIVFELDDRSSNEYAISVESEQVKVSGGSCQALLYGMQTIRQLLLQNDKFQIPSMTLVDNPRFEWRGLLLDCSRHFMDIDFVKRYIDLLSLYKMNVLHWHLTEDQGWRIEIDKYPMLTEVGAWRDDGNGGKYGGFYTKEEIREVVAYAEARGVTIVPEIELPGHSQAALAAYPQFSCTGGPFEVETEWGVFKEIYCAGNDSTFIFLEDVLTEVIELFPSEYIHIGGDEVPKFRWEHCEKCQRRIKEENLHDEHELQSYFIGRIGSFLKSKGKKMIGWDEILEGGLPDGAIVQSWRGFDGAKEAVSQGHQAILSPTSHSYFDYGLNDIDMEKVYSFDPIPDGISGEEAQLILGGECNMWTERAPQNKVDLKVFPRILAMSEALWSTSDKYFGEFRSRVRDHYPILDKLDVHYGFETVPVSTSTKIQNGELFAVLDSYDPDFQIYYAVNGKRKAYNEPVMINQPQRWSITFERGGTTFKDTIRQSFKPHIAIGLIPEYEFEYHASYTAGGEAGLTDGKKGSHQFRDGNWQGYWGDDVAVTIDLGEVVSIQELSSGYLQYNNAWIFYPEQVTYAVSSDGEAFEEVGVVENQRSPRDKKQRTQEFALRLDSAIQVRYVRLKAKNIGVCPDWHDAAGSDAWIFIDEFSVSQ